MPSSLPPAVRRLHAGSHAMDARTGSRHPRGVEHHDRRHEHYSGAEPIEATDAVIYGVIFVSMIATIIFVAIGVIALYKECFILCIIYGILMILLAAASICCAKHPIGLAMTITQFVLAPLILLFAVLIKRADRLAPESSQKLTNEEETTDSLKKKQRPEPDEADAENV